MEQPIEPKYTGLPRRYEETKPALDQVFTHSSILRIGEKILEKFQQNSSNDKEVAVKQCESTVWKDAEEYKNECVREALELASNKEAYCLKELEKSHVKHVKSEIARIEELMRQKCIEERFDERREGERRMQLMADELKRKYELEKMAEVKAARIEEQAIAENAAQEMTRRHDKAMNLYGNEMQEAKRLEIAALRYELEDIRLEHVQEAREEEQAAAKLRLHEASLIHNDEVQDLQATIRQLLNEKHDLEAGLASMTNQRDNYIEKHTELRREFTSFIERCRSDFEPGQADFLLPPN
uniref:uncharacterized protein C6orf163 homolog n=1 Tax=Styela clava TaxID=7725 RepID=UPI00193A38D5|nr:uncharacterized protein C6orf163 homolog [Styela clava]